MDVHVKVPRWLGEIVKFHMERLRLLNLEASPPAVAMGEVTRIWAEIIAERGRFEQDVDAPRLHAAFFALAAHATRWPAPAQLWEHLPKRPEPPKLQAPPTPPSDEERAKIRALLQQARQHLVR